MPRVQRGKVSATFEAREAAGCGSLRLLCALGGTRILQAAAPTAPPCFGRWPRSSPLQSSWAPYKKSKPLRSRIFCVAPISRPLSRCGGSSPQGSGRARKLCTQVGNFAAWTKPPSMRAVALPQAMTEGVCARITPSAALRAPAPSKREPLAKPKTLPPCQGLSLWERWQ